MEEIWEADFGEQAACEEVVCERCGERLIEQFRWDHKCQYAPEEDIGILFERLMIQPNIRPPLQMQFQSDDDSDFENQFNNFELLPRHVLQKRPNPPVSCDVCFTEFTKGSELITLPCMHQFHSDCIERWLREKSICPIDRKEVKLNY